ncbi:pentatricopeptide repeat-containing protein At5g27110 [Selaginella moellendorffii]|nr:pentatricopeptide repeat-containing protein At5g27110 [Selaginella moellendorffii]|eukprot:XP_002967248.2 pentatricopeptide repeat-containing protein At5g27110 [Selaginella moellendorffii]
MGIWKRHGQKPTPLRGTRRKASQAPPQDQDENPQEFVTKRYRYASLLRQCDSLEQGKTIHDQMSKDGYSRETYLGNLLVDMYGKCGSLRDAEAAFHSIRERNLFTWTIAMTAFAQNGDPRQAIHLFQAMCLDGVELDRVAFATAVGACSSLGDLHIGRSLHSTIATSSFQSDAVLRVSLINMYAKAGEFALAEELFQRLELKSAVAYTALIAAYSQFKMGREALGLYRAMHLEGVAPDKVAMLSALGACASEPDGRAIHACIICCGSDGDDTVASALVSMYGRFQMLESAKSVFFHRRVPRSSVELWNSMISAYVQSGHHREALELFEKMELEGVAPDVVTIVEILGVCSVLRKLDKARMIHAQLRARVDADTAVVDSLLNVYRECRSLEDAVTVFREEAGGARDCIAWNTMIAAYAECGDPGMALKLFTLMDLHGVEPTEVTYVAVLGAASSLGALTRGASLHHRIRSCGLDELPFVSNSLMQFYGSCGRLSSATAVFHSLERRDEVSWNTIMGLYTQHGCCDTALVVFHGMELEGVRANVITLTNVVTACTVTGDAAKGKSIHARVLSMGLEHHSAVGSALVAMYGKFGMLDRAMSCFNDISAKNTVAWNALMSGFAQQGQSVETVELSRAMQLQGMESDSASYLVVLFACSHGGLVEEALSCFSNLVEDGSVAANDEHYGCLIDLLARAGWLDRAEDLFRSMPFEPDSTSWMSLVGACKLHGDAGRGNSVPGIDDDSRAAPYVVVSNMLT